MAVWHTDPEQFDEITKWLLFQSYVRRKRFEAATSITETVKALEAVAQGFVGRRAQQPPAQPKAAITEGQRVLRGKWANARIVEPDEFLRIASSTKVK